MRHICSHPLVKVTMRPCYPSSIHRSYRINAFRIRTLSSTAKLPDTKPPSEDMGANLLQKWSEVGKTMGRNTMQRISVSAKNWWDRYEEFVGLVEVREAQGKVAEAEKDFMVARGIVREARESVESQQVKLKEVRDRLDRVSREDVHYLELATSEHKLLQEEKRLRALYINAEEGEREKFALFSASVRESHEKERTRAERTKNWSVIGSVLGAVIGVMGSTYINRVRLQELKTLLLEAQKGPISLQEAIHEHASVHQSQQKDLGDLIIGLRSIVPSLSLTSQDPQKGLSGTESKPELDITVNPVLRAVKEHMGYTKDAGKHLENLQTNYTNLEKDIRKLTNDMQNVKSRVNSQPAERTLMSSSQGSHGPGDQHENVILELSEAEQRLRTRIDQNSIYSTAVTCTVIAITMPILYVLLKGN
ncbi:mitochondrial potassium channel [Spea bombifrons]|uniref:mitochondrial potassium channel n=1 Tax=Spea bombifrons TaxID=233779 RepID=UPI00234BF7F6|nr:mitochondrial potassium channel [Spea bombifrons]